MVDPRSIVPLDTETLIDSVARPAVPWWSTADTSSTVIGAEVAATVAEGAFDYLDAPVTRVGAPHNPVPCSKPLEAMMVPSADQVVAKVERMYG